MGQHQDQVDDEPTGPLPIITGGGRVEPGVVPVRTLDDVPSLSRIRYQGPPVPVEGVAPAPALVPEPRVPEPPDPVRQLDLITAAVLAGFLILLVGVMVAATW